MFDKKALREMTDEELEEVRLRYISNIDSLKSTYGYTDLEYSVLRSHVSGEMGNMFVVMREYNMSSTAWVDVLTKIKNDNSENYRSFREATKKVFLCDNEHYARKWEKVWERKNK
jgi:hypothetical protein